MKNCRLIGVSTSRGEQNALFFIEDIAFGDDYADIGMLKLCGKGIAMGNTINEVREMDDLVIGSNDEDGIAEYLAAINYLEWSDKCSKIHELSNYLTTL